MSVVRGHENYLEFLPLFLAYAGFNALVLKNSSFTAAAALLFVFGRLIYALGYSSGNVNLRVPGFFLSLLAYYGLSGTMLWYFVSVVALN